MYLQTIEHQAQIIQQQQNEIQKLKQSKTLGSEDMLWKQYKEQQVKIQTLKDWNKELKSFVSSVAVGNTLASDYLELKQQYFELKQQLDLLRLQP